ncbi:uncharacterized protein LOC123317328 [Coccinella septempunctata]|uniref:uncharacterized protein LOC123317328 n=1 Tax=Coccinella septempunctata TaxID=41139 RepID=UPI001D07693B|nr:uncharacterized protein LOC123317328 [Coccinella septempunctata]
MGSSMSSSVGDRRANALRRSQRKSLTGACSNIDKVLKALKTYKGTEDSEEYKNMKIRIIQIEKNLQNKLTEPQQQFRTLHDITQQKIKTAFETLENKTAENTRSRGIVLNGNGMKPPSPNTRKTIEELRTQEQSDKPTAQSPTNENKRNSLLLRMSKFTLPKRESKSSTSECEVQEVTVEVHKSPEATRKSIMKYGVPVLPSPPHNSPPKLVSFNTPDHFEDTLLRHERRLKIIKQDIANLEIRISEFIGKKDGKHYNNLKLSLEQLGQELEGMHEEELLDQVDMCKNYVKSCLNFLESKALDEEDVDDEIFTNYTDSRIYGSTHDLLEGHNVRTTAI